MATTDSMMAPVKEQISSQLTFVVRWILPALWFLLAPFFILDGFSMDDTLSIAALVVLFVVGFLAFKFLLWNLADVVYDEGAHLLVQRRGLMERVDLANINKVRYSTSTLPPTIILSLKKPGVFGKRVTFIQKFEPFNLTFSESLVSEQLRTRALAARTNHHEQDAKNPR